MLCIKTNDSTVSVTETEKCISLFLFHHKYFFDIVYICFYFTNVCLFIIYTKLSVYLLIYPFYIFLTLLIIVLSCFSTLLYVRICIGMAMSQSSISRNRLTQLFFHFRVVQKDNHSIVSHLFRGFCKRKVSFSYFWSYNKIIKPFLDYESRKNWWQCIFDLTYGWTVPSRFF